jgi:hypothetical protein
MYVQNFGTSSGLKPTIISIIISLLLWSLFFLLIMTGIQNQTEKVVAIFSLVAGYLTLMIGTCKENLQRVSYFFKKIKEALFQFIIEITN